jgi:membrane protease YdiL (CAAX protease family)
VSTPSWLGIILLVHLLVVLPLLVWRSTMSFRAARAAAEGPEAVLPAPRAQLFASSIFMLGILFILAWLAGRDAGYRIFRIESFGARELLAGLLTFAVYLGLRQVSRAMRTEEESSRMVAHAMMPRSPLEWTLYVVMAIGAGIAEEAAYRGVGMYLLSAVVGNAWVAALILATAFALAHLIQEWKSVALVFLMALVMHALVAVTGTLVVAMVVHAVYDVIAAVLGVRETEKQKG